MPPVRARTTSSSQPVAGPSKRKSKWTSSDAGQSALPGVQKIKAAIRQTKRLLAKEKLAADVRVTSERKLKSLEADLAKAELSRRERGLSTRYHKVKFFERQKVVRRINQTKRKISETVSSDRRNLEKELFEHRVELNYINHYPKTKKYISLFPPDVRNDLKVTNSPSIETDRERDEIKKWIREQMAAGILSTVPEDMQRSQYSSNHTHWDRKVKNRAKEKDKTSEELVGEKDDFFEEDGEVA